MFTKNFGQHIRFATNGGRKHSPPLITLPGLLFLLAILFACAPNIQIVRESSSPVKPKWIEKPPHSDNALYFVGINTSSETLEEAQMAAIKDALSKLSGELGNGIESIFGADLADMEKKFRQQIVSESSVTISGAKVEDMYYEKMIRTEDGSRIERYDVYVLISFSKTEVAKLIDRRQKEKHEKLKAAYDYYLKGIDSEKRNRYYNARRLYKEAVKIINCTAPRKSRHF
jgi:hypothetical protein